MTDLSPDQILRDFEALRPGAEQLDQRWDDARHQRVLQVALVRATTPRTDRRGPRARWLVAGVAVAATLTGAAFLAPFLFPGQPPIPAAPSPNPPSTPLPSPTAATPSAAAPVFDRWTDSPIDLPIAPYLELIQQARQAELDAWHAQNSKPFATQQQQLARCLADAGFEYQARPLPVNPLESLPAVSGGRLLIPRLSAERDQVARYGYGEAELGHGVQVPGSSIDLPLEAWSPADRANLAYYKGLTEKRQEAFEIALAACQGDQQIQAEHPEIPTEHALRDIILDSYGAPRWLEEAEDLVGGPFGTVGFHADQVDNPDAFIEADGLFADPGLLAVNQDWISCMATSGTVPERVNLVNARQVGTSGLLMQTAILGNEQGSPIWTAEELRAFAVADYDCRAETDYVNRYARAQAAFQAEWIAAHQAEFDALVDTWNQKRKA